MLLELLDCEDLSGFEYDFVNDVSEYDWLTDRQEETIRSIYNMHFDGA